MDILDICKRAAAGTAMAGALGFGVLGVGSGIAAAKPGNPHPNPPGPGVSAPANPGHGHGSGDWTNWRDQNGDADDGGWNGGGIAAWSPGMPPGQNPFGPPGQVKRMATLNFANAFDLGGGVTIPAGTVLPNPFRGIPPGQWGSVNLANAWRTTAPTAISWLPPGSGLLAPQPLVWNSTTMQWGVTVNGNFTPYPIQFPAPTGG